MSITASGFWVPDSNTPLSLQGMFSAAATASENASKAAALRDGVPRASSEAALNALYAARVDPGTGLPLAPALGAQASINGMPVAWDGARWWSPGYTYMQIRSTTAQGFSASLGRYSSFGSGTFMTGGGGGLAAGATGISCAAAGDYEVKGIMQWVPNGSGNADHHVLVASTSGFTASAPHSSTPIGSGTDSSTQHATRVRTNSPNETIGIWGSSSPGAISVSLVSLEVTRVA